MNYDDESGLHPVLAPIQVPESEPGVRAEHGAGDGDPTELNSGDDAAYFTNTDEDPGCYYAGTTHNVRLSKLLQSTKLLSPGDKASVAFGAVSRSGIDPDDEEWKTPEKEEFDGLVKLDIIEVQYGRPDDLRETDIVHGMVNYDEKRADDEHEDGAARTTKHDRSSWVSC